MRRAISISPFQRHSAPVPVEDALVEVHVFAAGESLSLIAQRRYGDWRLWQEIADYNGIEDARRVAPGTSLVIPPRRLEDGRYESV